MTTSTPKAGSQPAWYADPVNSAQIRYWDGRGWTNHVAPKPAGWGLGATSRRPPWWQTWWAVVPGLFLCAPFGLVGLWVRPGVSTQLKAGLSAASVLFAGVLVATNASEPLSKPESSSDNPASVADSPTTEPTPSSSPAPSPAAPVAEPPTSVMPKVKGLSRADAEAAIAATGLTLGAISELPSARPPGTVLQQSSKVGASLVAGSAIALVVAAPYPQIPAVVGRLERVAVRTLLSAGFRVKVSEETRTSGRNDVVLSQTPPGAELAKPGSLIAVVVSRVVRPVAPPVAQDCTAGYKPCLPPASDYDCAGGSGDGPAYAQGPIYVTGSDPYGLDSENDGIACE